MTLNDKDNVLDSQMYVLAPLGNEEINFEYQINLEDHPLKTLFKIEPSKGKISSG